MKMSEVSEWSDELRGVVDMFARWRATRRGGERIPEPLWEAAIALAVREGVGPVSSQLGLGHTELKLRMQQNRSREPKEQSTSPGSVTFVEVLPTSEQVPAVVAMDAETFVDMSASQAPQSLASTSESTMTSATPPSQTGRWQVPLELELKGADGAELHMKLPADTPLPLLELVNGFWARGR